MTSYPDLTKDLNHLTDLYEDIQNRLHILQKKVIELSDWQTVTQENMNYLHKQINNHTKTTDTTCP